MKRLTSPGKIHGGKSYLASKIVSLMPPRCLKPNNPSHDDQGWLHYVEPYFGMGAVLLANDPEGISEVANDVNGQLTNFWSILASDSFHEFLERVESTPFSQEFWKAANIRCQLEQMQQSCDRVGHAVNFFINCRQSLAGRQDAFAGITRTRTRRGMNEQVSAWLNSIEGLPAVHARMKRVLILNKDAIEVIRSEDGPRTFVYADPPYLHETRTTIGEYGENEMTYDQHRQLLQELGGMKGKFILSGYPSSLYEMFERDYKWRRIEIDIANHSAGGKKKKRKTECLWMNY